MDLKAGCVEVEWNGFKWLRKGSMAGTCEYGNEPSSSLGAGNILTGLGTKNDYCTEIEMGGPCSTHRKDNTFFVGTFERNTLRHGVS
jgi:hypothetical protein